MTGALGALVLSLLSPSLLGGKVLSPGDIALLFPPLNAGAPAGFSHPVNPLLSDPAFEFIPDLFRTRAALDAGEAPLWNPGIGAGRPLLASQVHAPALPLTWLAFLLPLLTALAWIAAVKLFAAGVGAYLVGRALALSPGASLLAAVCFAFNPYLITWLAHPLTTSFVLMPWLVLFALRVVREGRVADALLLAVAVGLTVLDGHPETAIMVLATALLFAAAEAFARRGTGPPPIRQIGLMALSLGVGVALAAVVVMPFLELVANSQPVLRGSGLGFSALQSFVFPELWGRPDKAFSGTGPANFQERTAYLGALPLLLAVGGLAVRRARVQLGLAVLAAVALLLAFKTPVHSLVRSLPDGDLVALQRALCVVVFTGALLAGFGLERALQASPRERRRMLVVASAVAVLPLLWAARHGEWLSQFGHAIGQLPAVSSQEQSGSTVAMAAVWRWGVFAAGAALLLWLGLRRGRLVSVAAALAIAWTAFDLVTLDRGYQPQIARASADPRVVTSLAYVQAHRLEGRLVGGGGAFLPNLGARYGVSDVRAADLPNPRRFSRLYGGYGQPVAAVTMFDLLAPRAHDVADAFAARYVFLDRGQPAPPWLKPIVTDARQPLMLNPTALPRAWVAYGWRPASTERAAITATLGSTTTQLRSQPVIEGVAGSGSPGSDPAMIVSDREESVDVVAKARRRGFLVLDDSFYPGWTARVDGTATPIHAANGNFRAVALPAGSHRVRFSYRPASFRIGALISLTAVLGLLAGGLACAWRGRRRHGGDS